MGSPPHEFLNPTLRPIVRILITQIKHHNRRARPPIIHWSQAPVPLLSCGVPDFELDDGGVELDGLSEEGGADGGLLEFEEFVADKTHDEAGLGK